MPVLPQGYFIISFLRVATLRNSLHRANAFYQTLVATSRQSNFDQGQDKQTLEIQVKSCCVFSRHWGAASVGLGGSRGGADLGVPASGI